MDYSAVLEEIKNVPVGKRKYLYSCDKQKTRILIIRPERLRSSLKNREKYDVKKNIQIAIERDGKQFFPNHLRVFIDLDAKVRSDRKAAAVLFRAIEHVFDGEDPNKFKATIESLKLDVGLESSMTILYLCQLMMAEQDFGYPGGKIQPGRKYIMGYIRMIFLGEEEIDKLCWSAIRHPSRKKFREEPLDI